MEQHLLENRQDGDKVAVVAVHVGAADAASQLCIDRFNARMRQAYPQYDFKEAWTSRSLIRQASTSGLTRLFTPEELFAQLRKDGYTHVLIQSSCLVNDTEMQYLRQVAEEAKSQFKQLRLGEPLLSDAIDYERAALATAAALGSPKEANVLICCGTRGTEDAQYAMLDYTLRDQDLKGWFVGTADGYPSFDSLVKQLKIQKVKKVHLIPFLFAASKPDTSDILRTWAQHLQKAGYKVTSETRCLGDVDAILDLFEDHIRHAENYRRYSPKELKLMK